MSAIILNGTKLSHSLLHSMKLEVMKMTTKPGLAIILVGTDPSSQIYVRNKIAACQKVGIFSKKIELVANTPIKDLLKCIEELNQDPLIHGILVQFPLPGKLKDAEEMVMNFIAPQKDVDGLNIKTSFIPATPKGILKLLDEYRIEISGKHVVVLGRSLLVGKPLSHLILKRGAEVTVVHSKTENVSKCVQTGDIVIAAIGKPHFIEAEWIKKGAVVVDVGTNYSENGLQGDVSPNAANKASYITPVPGGVGPMTVASLLENVIEAKMLQQK